jgi:hypothetical protein
LKKRCDGIADCTDKFDETNCEMVIIDDKLYQKEHPPLDQETHQTIVKINVYVLSIDNLDEIEMTISVKFIVKLCWLIYFKIIT